MSLSLKDLPTIQDVINAVDEKYPNWIICFLDDYSSDYPHLKSNWQYLTNISNKQMQKIVIIDKYSLKDEDETQFTFCEILTLAGFVIRTKNELIPCSKCKVKAIPTEFVYNKMKEIGKNVPETWSDHCSSC